MNQEFSTQELEFLRKKGLFSEIAEQIPSTRPRQCGATISARYVRDVLKRKVTCDNSTTQEIKGRARELLNNRFYGVKHQAQEVNSINQ